MPSWIAERFEGLEEDPETHALVASAVAAEQVLELVDEGVTEFHFLTLNRSNLVLALARVLGRRPEERGTDQPGNEGVWTPTTISGIRPAT